MVETKTNWRDMPASGDRWQNCSLNQFRSAKNRKPIYFQKAALVIAACEIVLAERLASSKSLRRPTTIGDLYTNMSIIPAVWNINDFDKPFVKSLLEADAGAHDKIRDAAGQSSRTFLDHMASGSTVTAPTAHAVKSYIDLNCPTVTCGNVRAKPGVKGGTLNATDFEDLDVG